MTNDTLSSTSSLLRMPDAYGQTVGLSRVQPQQRLVADLNAAFSLQIDLIGAQFLR